MVEVAMAGSVEKITVLVLDAPSTSPYLRVGGRISVLFKETEVILVKGAIPNLSVRSRLPAITEHVRRGVLLSEIVLDYCGYPIHALITTKSLDGMGILDGDPLTILVKSTEISLEEPL